MFPARQYCGKPSESNSEYLPRGNKTQYSKPSNVRGTFLSALYFGFHGNGFVLATPREKGSGVKAAASAFRGVWCPETHNSDVNSSQSKHVLGSL
jgi:hypothetical protein